MSSNTISDISEHRSIHSSHSSHTRLRRQNVFVMLDRPHSWPDIQVGFFEHVNWQIQVAVQLLVIAKHHVTSSS